jgi:RNA polymerase sigma factor (sigma-70 family)
MMEDTELLQRYAESRDEPAFAELVRRHVNFVHSAALRQVNGDAHLAADVTQLVFTDLARKAAALAHHRVLAGWLFTSTRFAAAKAVRGEQRRRGRELEAQIMHELNDDAPTSLNWEKARPVLDQVLGELGESDREAILLRFFEGRDYASVGARLHLTDNTARMRVERALEKLRTLLARRGVTSTSAALAAALANQAVVAAPAGLAASVTGAALAGGGIAAGTAAAGAGAWATFMSMTKLQVGIASALAVAGATGFALQAQSNKQLAAEAASLRLDNAAIAALRAENLQLARTAAEVAEMRGDDAALARLNDEAAGLKERLQQVAQAESKHAALAAPAAEIYDVARLDQAPRPKSQPRPQYPFEMKRAGLGAEVVVDFVVDSQGNVQNARAVKADLREPKDVIVLSRVVVESSVGGDQPAAPAPAVSPDEAVKQFGVAAVEAVSQWKFDAGLKGGRVVNAHLQVPVVFAVDKGAGSKH